ncbi:RodZ domain-containing protein [Dokdonella sp.]|uniref:RodZ domain-containing protein n=1 Tax=Dokdonella sp. TaxID=2291710 RepID=UPI002F41642D
MRAEEASEVNEHSELQAVHAEASPMDLRERVEAPLGRRLVAAREKRGLTSADVATRLKLPLRLVERLERDDYAGISDGVFLRGYLSSYARLVGVPEEQVLRVVETHALTAPLVATGTISHTRYLFERYSGSATYLVLTAIIVVPAVWLATHGGIEQNLVRTTPLDPPARVALAEPGAASMPASTGTAGPVSKPMDANDAPPLSSTTTTPDSPALEQAPVVASMTPFPSVASSAPEAEGRATGAGAHLIHLKLAEQSWVEITAADGRRLEYGMLAAGSEHSYRSDTQVAVRIGNAQGAQVSVDGNAFDLAQFQRGNVAHFKLLADGSAARPARAEQ